MNRGRGRPKGTKNGHRFTDRWEPQRWKPIYDSILALAISGIKNKEIARQLKVTPAMVGMVLASQTGRTKLLELQKLKEEAVKERSQTSISQLQDQAIKNIASVINSGELVENAPFKVFDRSMQFLRATGRFHPEEDEGDKSDLGNGNNFNVLVADPALAKQIAEGLAKTLEVAAKHGHTPRQITTGRSVTAPVRPGVSQKVS